MRLIIKIAAAGLVLVAAQQASAFTMETWSGSNSDGSSRYADPDDQIRMLFGGSGGGGSNPQLGADPSGARTLAAQSLIVNQGVLAPNWYFSGRPSRR
jgi:hypothetical protein